VSRVVGKSLNWLGWWLPLGLVAFGLLVGDGALAWSGEVGGVPVEVGGYLETRQVFRVDRATPQELNRQRLQLNVRSWLSERLFLEIDSSLQNGGPATRASSAGFYNIDDVFQSRAPAVEIEEAFLRYDFDSLSIRAGQIKHAWGKLDRYQPNDGLNPERFADPLLLDEADRKIGVPSIEAEYFLPDRDWLPEEASLRVVVVPRYVPFRLPLAGERWFPPNAVPPPTFSAGAIDVPLTLETDNAPLPAFTAANATYAARFAAHYSGVDYALYYQHGIQTAPLFRLDARADVTPEDPFVVGTTILSPVFNKVQTWGGDLAFTLGRFGFRAELAYTRGRGFNRDLLTLVDEPALADTVEEAIEAIAGGATSVPVDLGKTFAISDALQWGVGVDTRVEKIDLLLEVSQTDVLERTVPLLITPTETVILADVRRSFLRDDLTLQLVSVYGASSDYTALMPRLTYRFHDRIEARLGYLHIAGRSRSRLGQYKDNDEGFIRLRLYL